MSTVTVSRPRVRRPVPDRSRPATARPRARRGLRWLLAGAAGLVPWTVLLALTLPAEHEVHQWRLTWAGFDGLLVLALTGTVLLARRRHPAGVVAALLTAVLLICDAWFDVSLDIGTRDVWFSAGLAVFVELPVAAYLIRRGYVLITTAPWRTGADCVQEVDSSTKLS